MRRKRIGGGRAKPSKPPTGSYAMAFSYLSEPSDSDAQPGCCHHDIGVDEANDEVQFSTVPETIGDNDYNRRSQKWAPITTGERVLPEKSHSLRLGRQEIDWTEKVILICIKCDKGGNLLICSNTDCPIAVHEECMHCSAWFDSTGNFCCPFCSYRRAVLDTREARKKAMLAKKALSVFLDEGVTNDDIQKQQAKRVRTKEPTPSNGEGDRGHGNTGNRLDGDDLDNHSVPVEKDRQEEKFGPECTTNICLHKGAYPSSTKEQNVVVTRCRDYTRPDGGGQHKIVIEQQKLPGLTLSGTGACYREDSTGNQLEIPQVGNTVHAEHSKLVDEDQNERVVQDEHKSRHLSVSLVRKETKLDRRLHIPVEGVDKGEMVKEHESRRPEEEMQEQPTVSSSIKDSIQQEHSNPSDSSDGDSADVSPHWRCFEKKNQNVVQSPTVDSPRRSVRKLSSELATGAEKKEKKNEINKSTEQLSTPTFAVARNKKVPWTAEEVQILKEGVQRFSTDVNQNIPWRAILEFGRNFFEKKRTPVDLKDKWRNINKR